LRRCIRQKWNHYELAQTEPPAVAPSTAKADFPPLLLTLPALARMRDIEGWLDDAEADLLLAAASRGIATVQRGAGGESGSYCGRGPGGLGAARGGGGDTKGGKDYVTDPPDATFRAAAQGEA